MQGRFNTKAGELASTKQALEEKKAALSKEFH